MPTNPWLDFLSKHRKLNPTLSPIEAAKSASKLYKTLKKTVGGCTPAWAAKQKKRNSQKKRTTGGKTKRKFKKTQDVFGAQPNDGHNYSLSSDSDTSTVDKTKPSKENTRKKRKR